MQLVATKETEKYSDNLQVKKIWLLGLQNYRYITRYNKNESEYSDAFLCSTLSPTLLMVNK